MTFEPHHGPMSNTWVLISFLGMIVAFAIWTYSPPWGFLLLLFSIMTFIASYVSAVRAPLMDDDEIELAVHEKYHGRKYPETGLHHGHLPKGKKMMHSRHKKHLVKAHLEDLVKPARKGAKKKAAPKKKTAKKAKKKAARRKR